MGCHFFLLPTNATLSLASEEPPWGDTWEGRSRGGKGSLELQPPLNLSHFQQTNWRALPHVLIHSLARHRARTKTASKACFCVVSALGPPVSDPKKARPACGMHWTRACPHSLPVVVIDNADVDYPGHPLCPALWPEVGPNALCGGVGLHQPTSVVERRKHCCEKRLKRVLRVTGGPPGLNRPVHVSCDTHTLTVPWLGHARVAPALVTRRRGVRIAVAMGVVGHFQANRLGFTPWRMAIRNACLPTVNCSRAWVTQAGSNARMAVELYSQSVFCLQPPGDTLGRTAIAEAVAAGCIPVFFHPLQQELFQVHWDAKSQSILYDWTAVPREELSSRAQIMMTDLGAYSEARIAKMQRELLQLAPGFVYSRPPAPLPQTLRRSRINLDADAVDVLVTNLPKLFKQYGW
ncbi:hypothetical protein AB1Y20_022644 [Prymnesium parvum]|uniref:Exostosin GT47 domain-containing protein n=1 Tax=Prymnesium parvum TaxID=97485 RepID=A0AB34JHL2_PRYPA